ncbi:hypothetical protein F5144DRAFT_582762 [Chaetomium tenue]|uniref:Uncharacterized protein n=1 Tax=Chaetomium tenue TaxID=1854479 RepID=A0ACB7P118_9PEZI|nr:hypothetical protein F5144DRAFT_582762 [Chaetomium globosum]
MAECSFDPYPPPVPILHCHPGVLDETHGFANRSMDDTTQDDTPLSDNYRHFDANDKDEAKTSDCEPGVRSLAALPAEILASILSYLAPDDLAHVSGTCRALYRHSTDDRLWRRHVQENLPGQQITSPYPYDDFRELYSAHDPHWFLPKYKIWFSDSGLPGRLIITHYNPREGTIEGYQLLCQNVNNSGFHTWHAPGPNIVSGFSPSIYLHTDIPAFRVRGRMLLTHDIGITHTKESRDARYHRVNGFQSEILLNWPGPQANYRTGFSYARSLSPSDLAARASPRFPHNHVWPSPRIASNHRVLCAGLAQPTTLRPKDRARSRSEVCDKAFRLHKWFPTCNPGQAFTPEPGTLAAHYVAQSEARQALPGHACVKLGEDVETYSTLDPAQYTPTPTRPFRGIFVGDYGGHGCEFIWINQPDDDDPPSIERNEGESDADYAARQLHAAIYRGRLEAVKLTGDVNVPRGEYTFVVDELGEAGFVREETKDPFAGARVVRSRAQLANHGFRDETFTDAELMIISPDLLAHNWLSLGHISYLRRVDIDRYIFPVEHGAGMLGS